MKVLRSGIRFHFWTSFMVTHSKGRYRSERMMPSFSNHKSCATPHTLRGKRVSSVGVRTDLQKKPIRLNSISITPA